MTVPRALRQQQGARAGDEDDIRPNCHCSRASRLTPSTHARAASGHNSIFPDGKRASISRCDPSNSPGGGVRAPQQGSPRRLRFPEKRRHRETSGAPSCESQMRIRETAAGARQFGPRRGQAHPRTWSRPVYCAADTIRWRLRPPPKRRGVFGPRRRSPLQLRPETAARLVPGDKTNGSAVDLPKAPIDLLGPCFFSVVIDRLIQATDQRIDQRSTSFRR